MYMCKDNILVQNEFFKYLFGRFLRQSFFRRILEFDGENWARKFAVEHVLYVFLFSSARFEIRFFDFPRLKHHDVEIQETEGYNIAML